MRILDNGSSLSSGNYFTNPSAISCLTDTNDVYCTLSMSYLLAQGEIPPAHKRVADNYMIIKKIYGFNTLQSRISNIDKNKLAKYDFVPLEYCTIKQINEELEYLKKWSYSQDSLLRKEADEILNIRLNELKFLMSNKYAILTNELYNGYMALEKYFEAISKYS